MTVTINKPTPRLHGLDLARGLALLGMVIVNFELAMGSTESGPAWLARLTGSLQGRAAGTFVVLAGIGATLGSAGARRMVMGPEATLARKHARWVLLRRGLFLFALGTLFLTIWPADILHFYGVYLSIGALLLFAPAWALISALFLAAISGLAFLALGNFGARWDWSTLTYAGLWTPSGFLRNLLFDGFHPVLPWVALYLFGMFMGRLPLEKASTRKTLLWIAGVAFVLIHAMSFWLAPQGIESEDWRALFATTSLPPTPAYLVAAISTAVLVICASFWLSARGPRSLCSPLQAAGKLALTLYVAHVVVGMGTLGALGRFDNQSLGFSLLAAFVFFDLAAFGALLWLRRFQRGPLEAAMRKICG